MNPFDFALVTSICVHISLAFNFFLVWYRFDWLQWFNSSDSAGIYFVPTMLHRIFIYFVNVYCFGCFCFVRVEWQFLTQCRNCHSHLMIRYYSVWMCPDARQSFQLNHESFQPFRRNICWNIINRWMILDGKLGKMLLENLLNRLHTRMATNVRVSIYQIRSVLNKSCLQLFFVINCWSLNMYFGCRIWI